MHYVLTVGKFWRFFKFAILELSIGAVCVEFLDA